MRLTYRRHCKSSGRSLYDLSPFPWLSRPAENSLRLWPASIQISTAEWRLPCGSSWPDLQSALISPTGHSTAAS